MCCSVVHLTRYVAVLGILVSGMCIAPPTYTYLEGRDYSTLMPGLNTLQVSTWWWCLPCMQAICSIIVRLVRVELWDSPAIKSIKCTASIPGPGTITRLLVPHKYYRAALQPNQSLIWVNLRHLRKGIFNITLDVCAFLWLKLYLLFHTIILMMRMTIAQLKLRTKLTLRLVYLTAIRLYICPYFYIGQIKQQSLTCKIQPVLDILL